MGIVIFIWGPQRERGWITRLTGVGDPQTITRATPVVKHPGSRESSRSERSALRKRDRKIDQVLWQNQQFAYMAWRLLPFSGTLFLIGSVLALLELDTFTLRVGGIALLLTVPPFLLQDQERSIREDGLAGHIRQHRQEGGLMWVFCLLLFSIVCFLWWFGFFALAVGLGDPLGKWAVVGAILGMLALLFFGILGALIEHFVDRKPS